MSTGSCAANSARLIFSSSRSSKPGISRRSPAAMGSGPAARGRVARGPPGPPEFHRHGVVRRPDEYGYFLCKVWDEWQHATSQGPGEPMRNAGRATHGIAVAGVCPQRSLRQGRCTRARWRRVQLRPLRVPGILSWQHSPAIARRHGVLSAASEIRLREIGDAAGVLQGVPLPQRLLG